MKKRIFYIVLTGGPCGGKTTILTYLCQKLQEKGLIVIVVPESATICIGAGISPVNPVIGGEIAQTAITTLAYQMENVFRASAERLSQIAPVVVLLDRGIVDASAYAPKELYEKILAAQGLDPIAVRDQRYNGVIHLATAADGAEAFYTLANNAARYETPEQARAQDRKIMAAWTGHEHLRVVDNTTDFEGKIRRAYAEVCHILGMPPIERERKFLVSFDRKDIPEHAQTVDIEQFYPISPDPDIVLRMRKRGQRGTYTYYRTTKRPHGHGESIEVQDFATEREYLFGMDLKRLDAAVVRKDRTCFVARSQYFELDEFVCKEAIPADGLLELEITDPNHEISFPDWLKVEREVTGDPEFSNFGIAKALARRR